MTLHSSNCIIFRTEEEFERLHAESQVLSKTKSTAGVQQKRNVSASKSKSSRAVKSAANKMVNPIEVVISTNTVVEEEVDTEDVNVDVEGPDVSVVPTPVINPNPVLSTPMPSTTLQMQLQDKVEIIKTCLLT